ncbi:patatin-like phospholipase family protein [Streptomyces sp. M10(2022)]
MIADRLPSAEWPERALLVTAVDAATGALHTFDRAGTVRLADAVTASCAVPAVWPAVSAGGGTWIDGVCTLRPTPNSPPDTNASS